MNSRAYSIPDSHRPHPWVLTIFLCIILWTAAQTAIAQNPQQPKSAPQAPRQSTSEGRQIFESTCAGCHGLDGHGGERGPDISTRQQVAQLSDVETLEVLRLGIPTAGMPPFASLGSKKLNSVLSYLRNLQGQGTAAVIPGDPQNGKTLFFRKARCSECHMVQGAGGFLGRDLSAYAAGLSAGEIRANLLRSGDITNRANKTAVITLRDSHKLSGVIRNEDNFSIQLQSLDGAFHFLSRSDVTQLEFLPKPIMPVDYGTTLKPAELDDIVSYLMTAAKAGRNGRKTSGDDDE